jgi:hypothetical protein
MRKVRIFGLCMGLVVLGLFVLAGCSKKSTDNITDTTNYEEMAIREMIVADSTKFSTSTTETTPDTTSFKIAGVDTVRTWWRWIHRVQRGVEVNFYPADDTHLYPYAYVSITDTLYGFFHILGKDSVGNRIHLAKPLKEVAKANAYFEKRGNNNQPYRGWRLIEISNMLFYSAPTCTRTIESVHITTTSSGYDLTLYPEDMLETMSLDSVLTFQIGDSVTLTVSTGDASDSVYLHVWHFFQFLRESFHNNGDGTFSGTWLIPTSADLLPWYHCAIDVIEHSTIDGDGIYDSRSWGLTFKIYNLAADH